MLMYEISLLSSAYLLWMRHDRLERSRVGRGMQAKYLILKIEKHKYLNN